MKTCHVQVTREQDTFVGRVLERPGLTTEGWTLDELVFMVRDAIALMWEEHEVQLELILASELEVVSASEERRTVSAA